MLDLFLEKHKDLAEPINSIIHSHIETYLSNIPFLKDVKESKLSVLATMCRFEAMDKDKVVFEENSPGDKLYILLNGMATVLAPQWVGDATALQQSLEWGSEKGDDKVVVADLNSGDYFGETAMFVNINRTSTVLTKQKCLFVSVEKKTFENFCAVCPIIKDKMTEVMKERMVAKLSSLGIPFLVGIPTNTLKSMISLVQIHEINNEEVIFQQGEQGDRFYIIVHGQVKVETCNHDNENIYQLPSSNDETKTKHEAKSMLGVLNAGNYFGEMALVSDTPRSATVSTIGKAILLSVGKEGFHSIFASNDNSLAEFTLRVMRASAELRHLLAHSVGLSTFTSYLERNLAKENIDFWLAVKDFRENDSYKEKEKAIEKAYEMYNVYCKEGAEHQVNLPCHMRMNIEKILLPHDDDDEDNDDDTNNASIDKTLFTSAQDEIYKLMSGDNYARFKKTPDFREIFKCLGILLD